MVLYINKAYQTGTGRNVLCAVDSGATDHDKGKSALVTLR